MKTNEQLIEMIENLAAAERVTKAVLGDLSVELLEHYQAHGDPVLINRLLGTYAYEDGEKFVLTPINFRIAVQYFRAFIPHASNWEDLKDYCVNGTGQRVAFKFEGKNKNAMKRIGDALAEWLATGQNIWHWQGGVKMDAAPKDYLGAIVKDIVKAMAEDKGNHSLEEVVNAILECELITTDAVLAAIAAGDDQVEQVAPAQAA